MEDQAYIGELIAAVIYLIAGVRMVRLSQRSGESPELLLGGNFLCISLSSFLYVIPSLPAFESLWTPLNFAARLAFLPAPVLLALFTRRVFRAAEPWTTWLVWGCAILLVAGVGGSTSGGDLEGFSISNGWFWLEWVGYTFPLAWTGLETARQYRQAQRRVRLGLCEPVVCNRYLLWTLYGSIQVCTCLVILGQYYEYEMTNQFSATWDAIYAASSIAGLMMLWFVFFPPAFYRRRFAGVTPEATSG
jgi:hypothetical protein